MKNLTKKRIKQIRKHKNNDSGYFGVCPKCKKNDGYLNIGRTHIYFCKEHKVSWDIGSNLFSSWRYETEEDWRKNADILCKFDEIQPLYLEKYKVQASKTEGLDDELLF